MKSAIDIRRLGTIDCDIVESTPIVFQNRLYRFEYIRIEYHGNDTKDSYFRFIDVATGQTTPAFGHGLHMGSAFVWEDTVYVSCVEKWGASRFFIMHSTDLIHWSEAKLILSHPDWQGYNTGICRGDCKFVMVFELGAPQELVGVPFTMFFAESSDLVNWRVIPEAVFGQDIYTGGPLLRYHGGYYYLFYLDGSYEAGFRTHVVRSHDLKNWSTKKLVLDIDERDRRLNAATFTPEQQQKIATAVNINCSDPDMCEFAGRLHLTFSWGNQRGVEFLAIGEADCTEREFCESFWQEKKA